MRAAKECSPSVCSVHRWVALVFVGGELVSLQSAFGCLVFYFTKERIR